MDKEKFILFSDVFLLYVKHRNSSAHTHCKNLDDAKRVRKSVIGKQDSVGSLTYSLLHNLSLGISLIFLSAPLFLIQIF